MFGIESKHYPLEMRLKRHSILKFTMPNVNAYGLSPALRVTGKISRLVNCLAGYELVVVEIADKEQIGTVIEIVRNRLGTNYTVEEHRRLSILELVERGYSREVIDEWVDYIE